MTSKISNAIAIAVTAGALSLPVHAATEFATIDDQLRSGQPQPQEQVARVTTDTVKTYPTVDEAIRADSGQPEAPAGKPVEREYSGPTVSAEDQADFGN